MKKNNLKFRIITKEDAEKLTFSEIEKKYNPLNQEYLTMTNDVGMVVLVASDKKYVAFQIFESMDEKTFSSRIKESINLLEDK